MPGQWLQVQGVHMAAVTPCHCEPVPPLSWSFVPPHKMVMLVLSRSPQLS